MVSEAKRKSNKRYDDKTYKQMTFRLRIEDDADIIETIENLECSKREWLRGIMSKDTQGYTIDQIISVLAFYQGSMDPQILKEYLTKKLG